jgi:hypothetical protein
MKAILSHLRSPAMVVACVSLVVALGGVSYAAGVLPKNSVGTTQLQKKAVTASKLRAGSVSGVKVKNGTLMATDFQAGQIPAGPQGPKGDKGDAGAPGISGYQVVHWAAAPVAPGGLVHSQVDCPTGKKAVGGGLGGGQPIAVTTSLPSDDGKTWYVNGKNLGNAPTSLYAYAICAHVG